MSKIIELGKVRAGKAVSATGWAPVEMLRACVEEVAALPEGEAPTHAVVVISYPDGRIKRLCAGPDDGFHFVGMTFLAAMDMGK